MGTNRAGAYEDDGTTVVGSLDQKSSQEFVTNYNYNVRITCRQSLSSDVKELIMKTLTTSVGITASSFQRIYTSTLSCAHYNNQLP